MIFADREDAGRQLAQQLLALRDQNPVVLGLPRGGVPVAFEVAMALGATLDVVMVRKLGVPFQPELGMGSIGEGGVRVFNDDVVREIRITEKELAAVEARERLGLERSAETFRAGRAPQSLLGRTVLIVDDGMATGSTARAACQVARAAGARQVVVATPVAAPSAVAALAGEADQVVCLSTPADFWAVGYWYRDFAQTSDQTVRALLERAAASTPGHDPLPNGGSGPTLR